MSLLSVQMLVPGRKIEFKNRQTVNKNCLVRTGFIASFKINFSPSDQRSI